MAKSIVPDGASEQQIRRAFMRINNRFDTGDTTHDDHDHGGGTGDGSTVDHGDLDGLSGDDHGHYSLVAGTRPFTGKVGGVAPTDDAHLATKKYVDDNEVDDHGELTGLGDDDHGLYLTESRHTALPGDHVTNGDSHDHDGGDGAQIDHGGLGGLSHEDHPQYMLVSDYDDNLDGVVDQADFADGLITPIATPFEDHFPYTEAPLVTNFTNFAIGLTEFYAAGGEMRLSVAGTGATHQCRAYQNLPMCKNEHFASMRGLSDTADTTQRFFLYINSNSTALGGGGNSCFLVTYYQVGGGAGVFQIEEYTNGVRNILASPSLGADANTVGVKLEHDGTNLTAFARNVGDTGWTQHYTTVIANKGAGGGSAKNVGFRFYTNSTVPVIVAADDWHSEAIPGCPTELTMGEISDGELLIRDGTDIVGADHGDISGRSDDDHPQYPLKTGWDPTAFDEVTLAFDDGTRTFSVTKVGDDFAYWIAGVQYTHTTAQTVVIDDTEGIWYIYFSTDTLTASQTLWGFDRTKAFVASLYWDATNNTAIQYQPELHSWVLDDRMHQYHHDSFGTRWAQGLATSINGTTTIDVTAGEMHDEDIRIAIEDGAGAGMWEQVLSPAECPIFYRDGAGGDWRIFAASSVPVRIDSTNLKFNEYTGGVWQLSNCTNNKYVAYWVVATSDVDEPIFIIPGQEEGDTLAAARDGNSLADMAFAGLPVLEHKAIARLLVKKLAGSPYYSIDEVADYRNVVDQPSGAGAIIGDHGALTGLGDNDHTQYLLTSLANLDAATELTISSSAVTITQSVHTIDTTGGAPADDLDTINGGTEGDVIWLYREAAGRAPWLTTAGNIVTPESRNYPIPIDSAAELYYDGSNWRLISCGHWGLYEDYTVSAPDSPLTAAQIQALIDTMPRYLENHDLTFQFGDGTFDAAMTTPLTWLGFEGGGKLWVLGNTGESGLHTNQAVILDFTAGTTDGIVFENCKCEVGCDNIRCDISDTAGIAAFRANYCSGEVSVLGCYGNGAAKTNTCSGVLFVETPGSVRDTYVSNLHRGIFTARNASVVSRDNDDTGTVPNYGLVAQGGVIMKYGVAQPAGVTANENSSQGGVIR